jgi:ketosteroid isomerase-like protein
MPENNVELVRRVYDEWGRGNWRPKFDFYDPEMEWGWSDDFPGLAGVYHDPAERNQRVYDWLSGWEGWRCDAEDYIVQGDHVVALTRYRGRGRGSGAMCRHQGRPPLDPARRQGGASRDLRRPSQGAGGDRA